jgi:flagellar L-ring protein precursor FlgH
MKNYISAILILLAITGCSGASKSTSKINNIQKEEFVTPPMYTSPVSAEGSLWSDVEGVRLYSDRRAKRIGDIVKVSIVEDPEAEVNANTQTSRNSGVSAAQLEAFGWMKQLGRMYPDIAQKPGEDNLFSASLGTNFDGKGSSDRGGHIKAYVPAEVKQIFPNGNLFISGQREIRVNHETQHVSVSGIIRAEDINQFNEIASSSIASAKIAYSGAGPIADKQKPGWAMRIVDYVWPF